MPPSRKYSERRPRMAKALEANTMNVLAAHGEDRRHRVDGEHDVGRLDQHEHGEQRRGHPLGVLAW